MLCSKCGKEMTEEDGFSMCGICIETIDASTKRREFINKQLGKYEVDKRYCFCYECVLDTLFGK